MPYYMHKWYVFAVVCQCLSAMSGKTEIMYNMYLCICFEVHVIVVEQA